MRRDTFLKSLAAMAAVGSLPVSAQTAALKMMIPANPGGGWDTTGRALGKAMQDAGAASSVSYDNKGGAAGAIGLAQFVNASKGDPNALMVMGAVMLGGIITGKPPVGLDKVTPLARLTSEYNVFVLPANSPFKTMKDVIEQLKKDPGSVKWGGGSRGSTGCGPCQDQLRRVPWGWRGHRRHPGWQRHHRRQRLQRVCGIHCRRQDARCGRHVFRTPQGCQRAYAQGAGHQRGHRQLAWRVRRPWHHGRTTQGPD